MGVSMAIASITAWFTPTVLFCAANLIIATIFIANSKNNNHHQPAPDSLSTVSSFLHRATSFNSSSYSATTTETPPKYSSLSRLAQSIHSSSSNDLSSSHGQELPAPSEKQPLSLFQRSSSVLIKSSSDSPGQLGGLERPPSFVERVKSFRIFDWGAAPPQPETVETTDPRHNPREEHRHVIRSKSDSNDPSSMTTKKKKKKKKKSLVVEMKKSRSEMRMAPSDDDEDELRRPATARDHAAAAGEEEEELVDARADEFINRFKQQLKLQRLESLVRYKEMLNRRRQ